MYDKYSIVNRIECKILTEAETLLISQGEPNDANSYTGPRGAMLVHVTNPTIPVVPEQPKTLDMAATFKLDGSAALASHLIVETDDYRVLAISGDAYLLTGAAGLTPGATEGMPLLETQEVVVAMVAGDTLYCNGALIAVTPFN